MGGDSKVCNVSNLTVNVNIQDTDVFKRATEAIAYLGQHVSDEVRLKAIEILAGNSVDGERHDTDHM